MSVTSLGIAPTSYTILRNSYGVLQAVEKAGIFTAKYFSDGTKQWTVIERTKDTNHRFQTRRVNQDDITINDILLCLGTSDICL